LNSKEIGKLQKNYRRNASIAPDIGAITLK
jgi:hypothetical protein